MGYTPYDIYVIHGPEDDSLDIEMRDPHPSDEAVKILGLHAKGG